jgi:hypothetical protein
VLFLLARVVHRQGRRDTEDHVSEGRLHLCCGSDSREELSREDRAVLGTGSAEGRRTDTIMLLYVPIDGRPAPMSLPRDSLVGTPGRGEDRSTPLTPSAVCGRLGGRLARRLRPLVDA